MRLKPVVIDLLRGCPRENECEKKKRFSKLKKVAKNKGKNRPTKGGKGK